MSQINPKEFVHNTDLDQFVYIYIYMLSIAGQTAEPIGLKFFVDTHGWPGV